MKLVNEGNLYNTETAEVTPNRSNELGDIQSLLKKNFWDYMKRQNIDPKLAEQIAQRTFSTSSDA
jgi:hypothetical protein